MGFLNDMAEVGLALRMRAEETVPPEWHMQASAARTKLMLIIRLSKDGRCLDMSIERKESRKKDDAGDRQEEERIFYPVSEESMSRTSSGAVKSPHPLCDDYKYIFGKGKPYYLTNLNEWIASCGNGETRAFLQAVAAYVEKGNAEEDISRLLLNEKDIKDAEDAFVLWTADGFGECWKNAEIRDSWIEYYSEKRHLEVGEAFDMISGKTGTRRSTATKNLSFGGGNRKWFSFPAKDELRWKGRFSNENELVSVTDETADLIETGIRYLFGNPYRILTVGNDENGKTKYAAKGRSIVLKNGEVIAAWSMKDPTVLISAAMDSAGFEYKEAVSEEALLDDKLSGKDAVQTGGRRVCVAVLGGLTTGRSSLDAYFSYESYSDFAETIGKWTNLCAWERFARMIENGNMKYGYMRFVPGVKRLIETLIGEYDRKAGKFSVKNAKLLESIERETVFARLSGRKVPVTLVNAAKRRAGRLAVFMDAGNEGKNSAGMMLAVCLATLRKHYADEYGKEFGMNLDESNESRDYLYGRLLAVYHATEEDYFSRKGINGRITDALKYQEAFSRKPDAVARRLDEKKSLWFRCEGMQEKWHDAIGEIVGKIGEAEASDPRQKGRSLSPEYLFGFYAELKELKNGRKVI